MKSRDSLPLCPETRPSFNVFASRDSVSASASGYDSSASESSRLWRLSAFRSEAESEIPLISAAQTQMQMPMEITAEDEAEEAHAETESETSLAGRRRRKEIAMVHVPATLSWVPDENIVFDLMQHFQLCKKLGRGVSCSVWDVRGVRGKVRGHRFAMKLIRKDLNQAEFYISDEVCAMRHLKHPGVLGYRGVYVDKQYYAILTDLCGPSLFEAVTKQCDARLFEEDHAKRVVRRLLETLTWLHHKTVVHRDLKLENIVFPRHDNKFEHPIIIDWADAIPISDPREKLTETVGTTCYAAPEKFRTRRAWECFAGDVWAIGVITFEILTGKRCFRGKKDSSVQRRVVNGDWSWPDDVAVSRTARNFVATLLTWDSAKRPTARMCLGHPWLRDRAKQ